MPVDTFSMREAYYVKTMKRILSVRDLIPFANEQYITINEKNVEMCFYKHELEKSQTDKV